jgi:hypothetical protein
LVVAASLRACGGGAVGARTVSATVPPALWPAGSVAVYVNESVRSAASTGAVACTVAPDWLSVTAPSAGPLIVYVSWSPVSGSLANAPRSMFVGVPASTTSVVSVATGGRLDGASTSIDTAPATV